MKNNRKLPNILRRQFLFFLFLAYKMYLILDQGHTNKGVCPLRVKTLMKFGKYEKFRRWFLISDVFLKEIHLIGEKFQREKI